MRQVDWRYDDMFVARSKVTGVTYGPFDSYEDARTWQAEYARLLDRDDLAREASTWEVTEVTFTEDPHDVASYTTRFTFGPGRLEDISVEIWRDLTARVSGQLRVYCGNGSEHPFSIDSGFITGGDWTTYVHDTMVTHPTMTNPDDIRYDVVGRIVDEVLGEEWSDPCEVEYEDEESSLTAAEAEIMAIKVPDAFTLDLEGDDRTETEQDGLAQAMWFEHIEDEGLDQEDIRNELDARELNRLRDETN